jgi:hypothetical protein
VVGAVTVLIALFLLSACVEAKTPVTDSPTGAVWVDKKVKNSETTLVVGIDPEKVDWKELLRAFSEVRLSVRLNGRVIVVDGVKYEGYYIGLTPPICNVNIIDGTVAWGDCDEWREGVNGPA